MNEVNVYHGNVVYSESEKKLVEYSGGYIVVEDGKIEGVYDVLPEKFSFLPLTDFGEDVIVPAFSDLHTHAPQYPQRGLKTDALLSEWLKEYTFPLEGRFADPTFAEAVYDAFADDLIAHGTMQAACFGTIHSRATELLIEKLDAKGIRAYVGKVNMDMNCPEYLCEEKERSISETEAFLEKYAENDFAKPILVPRFAPTCSPGLLAGLGKLAKKYGVGVHTHLVESRWEAKTAVEVHRDSRCDTEIYERAGMLGYGPFIGAHFIFPSDKDVEILTRYNGIAVHCPDATTNVIAGIMPAAELSEKGVRIAIGSDVAAGQSLAVYRQVASAVRLSKIKSFYEPEHSPVSFAQAFFMATKRGGELFGKVGSFEKGYTFNALVLGGMTDRFLPLRPAETVERFCSTGETKDIRASFLNGIRIK